MSRTTEAGALPGKLRIKMEIELSDAANEEPLKRTKTRGEQFADIFNERFAKFTIVRRQTDAGFQVELQLLAKFNIDERRVDQAFCVQINLIQICIWRRHILHVAVRHQFREDAQRLAGGCMMLQHQTRRAQFQHNALFIGEQRITGDRAIGQGEHNEQDKTLFVAQITENDSTER